MFSIDLKDAYLRVPVHLESRKYLRFIAFCKVFQFKVLCFGLSTAPQVFTRVMAPVSAILRLLGVRILSYLDDWLVLALSRVEALRARDLVLNLCHDLGIIINYEKSYLSPSQTSSYLGMAIRSPILRAFPTQERVQKLLSQIEEFLSCRQQGVISWRSLLGRLSSLCLLVPEGCLCMRSLQLRLRVLWDFLDESVSVAWTPSNTLDLFWWSDIWNLLARVPLQPHLPDLLFWPDASDHGWGANLSD